MRNFFDWLQSTEFQNQKWLVLGKGPSFCKYSEFVVTEYVVLGLNDVVRETNVKVAHALDVAVVDRLGDNILKNAEYLLMPWFPHIDYKLPLVEKTFHKPSSHNLEYYIQENPVIRQMHQEDRLLWYDASSAKGKKGPGNFPEVRVGTFSAAAVINLISRAGVKSVRTLGIDGGKSYSSNFTDLEDVTLLDAGQESYNLQFADMANTIRETKVDLAPLDIEAPVKVFVGTQPEQMLATKVLEYSIRKHASMSVEVIPIYQVLAQKNIDLKGVQGKTPFSFQRFTIPGLKNYKGKAIYVDSDMQVFTDIRELWAWPLDDAQILTVHKRQDERVEPQFSVMVLDCETLDWDVNTICSQIESGKTSYEDIVYKMGHVDKISYALPNRWNDLEHYKEGETSLIHYTDMVIQPWISINNVYARIWCKELIEAVTDGFISISEVKDQIDKSWIRPSLLYQVENKIDDPQLIPRNILRKLDKNFVPPFHLTGAMKKIADKGEHITSIEKIKLWLFARAYHIWVDSGLQQNYRKIKITTKKVKRVFS